ncbi:hypothetical protein QE152_g25697 [Popillia japonica]|uniref:Uncharacterized protein n=1 Tax=Popillia japonica TaxID=7064 RepID=A0AAW1K042_POPJA
MYYRYRILVKVKLNYFICICNFAKILLRSKLSKGRSLSITPLKLLPLVLVTLEQERVDIYPTDPHKDYDYSPVGYGQLTNTVKRI